MDRKPYCARLAGHMEEQIDKTPGSVASGGAGGVPNL